MNEASIKNVMARLPEVFLSEKAVGIHSVVQFHLTGQESGDWVITIQDGACKAEERIVENPNLRFEADSQDLLEIITGKGDAMRAFMQGKIRLNGDIGLALKLINLFKKF